MRLAAFNAKCEGHSKGFVNFIFHKKSNENVKKYVKQKVNYPQTKTRHINRTFYSVTSLNLYWNSFAKPINRITKSFSGLFLFQRSRTIPIKVYFSFDMITIELYISFLPAYLTALMNLYHMWTFSSVNKGGFNIHLWWGIGGRFFFLKTDAKARKMGFYWACQQFLNEIRERNFFHAPKIAFKVSPLFYPWLFDMISIIALF